MKVTGKTRLGSNQRGKLSPGVTIILLASVMVGLGVELYARANTTYVELMHPRNLFEHFAVSGDFLTEYHPEKGRRLRPNAKVVVRNHYLSRQDVPVMVNALGFRDEEIPLGKRDRELRLLVLGDSVTISDYLPAEESYVEYAERFLADLYQDKLVEAVNGGISDVGVSEIMGILREQGVRLAPDHLVLAFYLNDSLEPWGFAGKFSQPGFIRRHSVAAGSIYRAAMLRKWIQGDYAKRFQWISEQHNLDWRNSEADFEKLVTFAQHDWGAAWQEESWARIRPYFEELRRLAKEHGFTVTIAAMPVSFQVGASFLDDTPQRRLKEISEEFSFHFFDTLPLLRPYKVEELYYDQCHFTPFGNKLVGEGLAGFLAENVIRQKPMQVKERQTLSAWQTNKSSAE